MMYNDSCQDKDVCQLTFFFSKGYVLLWNTRRSSIINVYGHDCISNYYLLSEYPFASRSYFISKTKQYKPRDLFISL